MYMVSKEALRVSAMKRRAQLSESERKLASLQACQRLFDEFDWAKVQRINVYKALHSLSEADPSPLVDRIRAEYPNVEIITSPFRVDAEHPTEIFDIVVVPIVAFDRDCNRVGMGGGWYDGYFAAHPLATKVGLAFETQKVHSVPISPVDVPMDKIVTERTTYAR